MEPDVFFIYLTLYALCKKTYLEKPVFLTQSAFSKCEHDCRREKLNHCITLALFCQHNFFLSLLKFKTIKIKPEQNPYAQHTHA